MDFAAQPEARTKQSVTGRQPLFGINQVPVKSWSFLELGVPCIDSDCDREGGGDGRSDSITQVVFCGCPREGID